MKKKYLIISITFSSILICLCLINETYAKYLTSANSITNAPIARWKILVNNEDITLGTTSENIITPIFPGNDNISEGVLAPNAEGYFDLIIDASNVDVSFSYEILIKANDNSIVKELIATGYQKNGSEIIQLENSNDKIQGTINLNDQEKTISLRIYIKWDDSLNIMDNQEDTNTTQNNEQAKLDVSISVIQKT